MIKIHRLAELNHSLGAAAVNDLLKNIAELLQAGAPGFQKATGRHRGSEFFLLLETEQPLKISREVMDALFSRIYRQILLHCQDVQRVGLYLIGVVWDQAANHHRSVAESRCAWLAQIDNALLKACQKFPNGVLCLPWQHDLARSSVWGNRYELRQWLLSRLDDNQIKLRFQSVVDLHQHRVQYTLFALLVQENGELCAAANYIAAIDAFEFGVRFDQQVLTLLADEYQRLDDDLPISLHLTRHALTDLGFQAWFERFCRQHPQLAMRLVVEIPENWQGVLAIVSDFVCQLHQYHLGFAVDRFGSQGGMLNGWLALRPRFIRLDASLSRQIAKRPEAQIQIRYLLNIAQSTSATLIAEGVESDDDWEKLKLLGVTHAAGQLFDHQLPPIDA